jgi:hypothetical protein
MQKIFFIGAVCLALIGCVNTNTKINTQEISNKGGVIGSPSANGGVCIGALVFKKILSKNPLTLDQQAHLLVSKSPYNLAKILTFEAISAEPVFVEPGEYAATAINCTQHVGNATFYYRHALQSGGPIAFFNVNRNEIVDIGMLNITPEYSGILFFKSFKRYSSREVMPTLPSIMKNFLEQNPEMRERIVTRHMVAVPVPPLPADPAQQGE